MHRQTLPAAIADAYLKPLPPEEFERRLGAAIRELDGPELENLQSLIRWFQRRYPTAKERLAYVRRACAEWTRTAEIFARDPANK